MCAKEQERLDDLERAELIRDIRLTRKMERHKLEEQKQRQQVSLKDSVQDLLYINKIIEQSEAGQANAQIDESVLVDLRSYDAAVTASLQLDNKKRLAYEARLRSNASKKKLRPRDFFRVNREKAFDMF